MDKIHKLYSEWLSLQPLKPHDQNRLDSKFKLEFNYNSNHLEGNTLTYGQTKLLLMFNETSGNASLKDYEEMKAHNVGLEMIKREAADKDRPLTEIFIRELNNVILVQNYWKDAENTLGQKTRMEVKVGEYKTRPNSVRTVTGEIFEYASPEETPSFMTDLVTWYNTEAEKGELSPIQLAALLHFRYIRIHPFEDGNGRIARLLVNYVLLRNNYPMIVIKSDDKENYLRILHQCDINVGLTPSEGSLAQLEQIKPFVDYLKTLLIYALEISIKAAKGENIEEDDDFAKKLSILEREARQKEDEELQIITQKKNDIYNPLEKFFFPFVEEIKESLAPSGKMFNNIESSIYIYNDNKLYTPNNIEGIEDIKDYEDILFTADSKYIEFRIVLLQPSFKTKEKKFFITLFLILHLETDHYIVTTEAENKQYDYISLPTEEDRKKIINEFQNKIVTSIELEINES